MSRRGLVLFAAMSVIWGVPYLFIKVAVRELTPAELVFARTAIAAVVLLPIAVARGELRPLRNARLALLVFAVIEIAVPWFFLARAEQRLSSSLTALLIAATPLVGVLVLHLGGTPEPLDRRQALGLLVGIAGVVAIVGIDTSGSSLVGVAEVGVVAVCYAVGPIVLSRWLADLPSLGVIAASLGLCAVAYAPFAALSHGDEVPGAKVIASVLVLALVCTTLAFVLFFALIAEIGPVRATVITYVNPAVAALAGVLVLDESFTPGMALGFALVLVGSALATRRAAEPAEPAPAGSVP
jgi:drug/metabolite transporter (DMT)-like permease